MFSYEIDWAAAPAWVQAVGSIAAILVAIVVDRGSGRRAIAAALAVRVALIHDARDALVLARDVIRNFTDAVSGDDASDRLPDPRAGLRRVAAARRTVEHYLAMDVPDVKLVASLSTTAMILRPLVEVYEAAIASRSFFPDYGYIHARAVEAHHDLDAVVSEYDSGVI